MKEKMRDPLMFIHENSVGNEELCNEWYSKIRPVVIELVAKQSKGDYWQGLVIFHPKQACEDLDYFDVTITPNRYPFLYFAVQCENELDDEYIIDYLEKNGLKKIE